MGTDLATLSVIAWQDAVAHAGHSAILLSTDIKAAFYSVLKEFVLGLPPSLEDIQDILDSGPIPPAFHEAICDRLGGSPVLAQTDIDPHLFALVSEANSESWWSMREAKNYIAPRQGTRPGMPMANDEFNGLFLLSIHFS